MPIVECPSRSLAIFGGQGQENIAWEIVDDARKVAVARRTIRRSCPSCPKLQGWKRTEGGITSRCSGPTLIKSPAAWATGS
jgi:hypothetical protein